LNRRDDLLVFNDYLGLFSCMLFGIGADRLELIRTMWGKQADEASEARGTLSRSASTP
jgi:hypothetical protein